jgi:hypothetical protein
VRVDGSAGRKEGLNMTHVDVVKNEWLAGYQVVIGRAVLDNDTIQIDAGEPGATAIIEAALGGLADSPAAEKIKALHAVLRGDYVFATEAHDEAQCPYQAMVVRLRAEDVRAAAHA